MGGTREHEGRSPVRLLDGVLYGADKQVAGWVAERIPGFDVSDSVRALGVLKDGRMAAGVTYERYNGVHVECSIAADPHSNWASRRVLFRLFEYPFIGLGCEAISLCVASSNLPSLRLATGLGFEPEAIIALAAQDGSNILVLKQWRDKCRWIDYGQKQSTSGTGPVQDREFRGAVQPG